MGFEYVISIDDGRKECVRVGELLDKYGLRGLFYIAPFEGKCNMTIGDIVQLSKKHEIGGHTLTHCLLTKVELPQAKSEIEMGKQELESIIGKRIKKFAYPRGYYNEDIKQLLKNAGYVQGRTMKMGIVDRTGYDAYEIPVSAQNYPRPEYNGDILKGVIDKFEEAKAINGYFNFVIHTDDIGRFNQWEMIEKIFQYISKNK